jgi:hypothetical protein
MRNKMHNRGCVAKPHKANACHIARSTYLDGWMAPGAWTHVELATTTIAQCEIIVDTANQSYRPQALPIPSKSVFKPHTKSRT